MFRHMRLKHQELTKEETENILRRAKEGILAVNGDDGYPYCVPVNFGYADGKIYFHGAIVGSKLSLLLENPKVCFTAIEKNEIVKEEYTTYFTSAICFGKARILELEEEKTKGLWVLCDKYMPELKEETQRRITKGMKAVSVVEIDIEHMTGKQASELI